MPETQLKQRKTKGGISASKKDVKIGGGGEGSGLKEILEAKEALKENIQMKLTLSSQRRSGVRIFQHIQTFWK